MATEIFLAFGAQTQGVAALEQLAVGLLGSAGVAAVRPFTVNVLLGERLPVGHPELVICELRAGAPAPAAGRLRFSAASVGPRADFELPAHLYLQFSAQPESMSFADYSDWYQVHQDENIAQSDALRRGWRFRLDALDAPTGPRPTHLAVYEIEGPIEQVTGDLAAARAAGVISLPDWFDRFASLEAVAVGPRAPHSSTADS